MPSRQPGTGKVLNKYLLNRLKMMMKTCPRDIQELNHASLGDQWDIRERVNKETKIIPTF